MVVCDARAREMEKQLIIYLFISIVKVVFSLFGV